MSGPTTMLKDPVSGKSSATRAVALILVLAAFELTTALSYYLIKKTPEAAVIAAVGGVLGALVASGCVAIVKRSRSESVPRVEP
jgi:membrane associated rhomboid family serine protease